MKAIFQGITRLAIVLLVVYAASSFGMKFAIFREVFARLFSTQSKIVCEMLANEQIAELAVRKIKWRVTTSKESLIESSVVNTVYALKFGFDLSEINRDSIQVDDDRKIVTVPLPPIRLLSVDHFCTRTKVVDKASLLARALRRQDDPGTYDAAEEVELKKDIEEQGLVNPCELAKDFECALQPLWKSVGTYTLKVKPHEETVDVDKMFEIYHAKK